MMEYKIKSRIWIEANGDILLGKGRVNLLKAIEQTGSLSKAAKSMGMSYKKAWTMIDDVNSRAFRPVIKASIGGKGGGGTKLTEYGKSLVNAYDSINNNCSKFLENQMSQTTFQ